MLVNEDLSGSSLFIEEKFQSNLLLQYTCISVETHSLISSKVSKQFLTLLSVSTHVRNFVFCRICQNPLMFLQDVLGEAVVSLLKSCTRIFGICINKVWSNTSDNSNIMWQKINIYSCKPCFSNKISHIVWQNLWALKLIVQFRI